MSTAEGSVDAARERAVEVLTHGYAEGVLSESELEGALDRVYRARTLQEVDALAAALVPATAQSPSPPALPAPSRVSTFLSGQERTITGTVPPTLHVRSRLGYVELDLTRATFRPGLTEIDVRAFMGYVHIRLPAGLRVESEGRAVLGYFALRGGGAAAPDSGTTVRIKGRAAFGYAECWVQSSRHVEELPGEG